MTCQVLVVDDDASILQTVAQALELEGYEVATARNGKEALERVEAERPKLVVLDMRMPVMDGWQFARALRDRGIQTHLLVMTAARNAESWAAEVGADAYLAKPFDLLELLDTVSDLCRSN